MGSAVRAQLAPSPLRLQRRLAPRCHPFRAGGPAAFGGVSARRRSLAQHSPPGAFLTARRPSGPPRRWARHQTPPLPASAASTRPACPRDVRSASRQCPPRMPSKPHADAATERPRPPCAAAGLLAVANAGRSMGSHARTRRTSVLPVRADGQSIYARTMPVRANGQSIHARTMRTSVLPVRMARASMLAPHIARTYGYVGYLLRQAHMDLILLAHVLFGLFAQRPVSCLLQPGRRSNGGTRLQFVSFARTCWSCRSVHETPVMAQRSPWGTC